MAEPPRGPGGDPEMSMSHDPVDNDAARLAERAALSPILGADTYRSQSSAVRVDFGARSHRGASRTTNEDHYMVVRVGRHQETLATSLSGSDVPPRYEESGYAMLVADGLGAGGSGSVASRVALSSFAHLALRDGKWNVRIDAATVAEIFARSERVYAHADAAVRAQAGTNPVLKGMTTALTVAYTVGDDLFVAHVGHSRAYLFRAGALMLLTRDHTVEGRLADRRRPAAVERAARDLRHILTDAVGAPGAHPAVEVERFQLMNGDLVLLCTNGLTDMLDDDQIADVLAMRRRPDEQCAILTELANREGGADNVTVVLAEYHIPES